LRPTPTKPSSIQPNRYILILDLGADLVRVYTIDQTMNLLTAKTLLKTKAGSRPRYAAFSLDPIAAFVYVYARDPSDSRNTHKLLRNSKRGVECIAVSL